jgi:8-oxo-dGTP diphosphatase
MEEVLQKPNINTTPIELMPDFRFAQSVDCVIFGYDGGEIKVLLIESDLPAYKGQWSLLGDVLHPDEDLDKASYRVLQERTGLSNMFLEQVKTFSAVNRHPAGRVITTAYLALVNVKDYQLKRQENSLHWHSVSEISTMAFDHKLILDTCLLALKKKIQEEPIIFNLLDSKFSLRQLQQVFEAVLGIEFDRRNFRKKLFTTGMLKDEHQMETDVHHRPGKLYSFNPAAYEKIKGNRFVGLQF